MAARQPGAPSIADTARMQMNAEMGAASTSRRYQWQLPLNEAASSNEFPIVPVPKDPYDDVANIKYVYAQQDAGKNWVVPFDQSDAQYMLRKRNAQEKAEFDAWIMQKFDITDPAQNLMLQNIAPELFQRREEVIDSQQALVSAYAKMRLRGAKSLSDLELEWLIETGRVELPQGPIWNPKAWRQQQVPTGTTDEEWNKKRYEFGLFSPIQFLTAGNGGQTPTNNEADVAGSGNVYNPARLPYPADHWRNQWSVPAPYPYAGNMFHGNNQPTTAQQTAAISGTTVQNFRAPPAPAPAQPNV